MGRLIGYARVSTAEQDLGLQLAALRRAGCSDAHIFCDTASGARMARPGLEDCVHALEPGDTLVVWRLDRLGRSMTHLVPLIQALLQRHVSFRSLSDGAIDTTTASGELVFHIFSALAQFERRLIQERTQDSRLPVLVARKAGVYHAMRRSHASAWRTRCIEIRAWRCRTFVGSYKSPRPRSIAMWPWADAPRRPRSVAARSTSPHRACPACWSGARPSVQNFRFPRI